MFGVSEGEKGGGDRRQFEEKFENFQNLMKCVFDKEGPLVTSVHFFVHRGEMKINVYKVLLRRETNCNALNGFSLWSPDKKRKEMQTSVFSPLNLKGSKDGCESKCYYSGDLSLFIPLS